MNLTFLTLPESERTLYIHVGRTAPELALSIPSDSARKTQKGSNVLSPAKLVTTLVARSSLPQLQFETHGLQLSQTQDR
jgi:hypothetical protein